MNYEDAVEVPMQNLGDVPDLSGMTEDRAEPWENGWYAATVLPSRSFTSKEGNDMTFTTEDAVSKNGNSRNLNLQLEVKRASDGRSMMTRSLINYVPSYLGSDIIAQVLARKAAIKEASQAGQKLGWDELFRPFMALTRIGTLQRIAGVRQFERKLDGGLDLAPLAGRACFVRLGDDKEGKYKEVAELSDVAPKRGKVL